MMSWVPIRLVDAGWDRELHGVARMARSRAS